MRRLLNFLFPIVSAVFLGATPRLAARDARDVLDEYHNRKVTALVEDSETTRLALGAAWDDALGCRALADYLRPWRADPGDAEAVVRQGSQLYELVKCVDDGINSTRLARDSRDEPRLMKDVAFWQDELALAAIEVLRYAAGAASFKENLRKQLLDEAAQRGLAAGFIDPPPWADPQREAWRRAGPATGVRLPIEPRPGSLAEWWNQNLSLAPGYLIGKMRSSGEAFFTPEMPVGGWGDNVNDKGQSDWTRLNRVVRLVQKRGGTLLLELPTLQAGKTPEQLAEDHEQAEGNNSYVMWPCGPASCLPKALASDPQASLVARELDGTRHPYGGVQLFEPVTARAYGDYLKGMAANLKRERLYDAVAAIHLELGDWTELPETVDYSAITRRRWQQFMAQRTGKDAALELPVRTPAPRAKADWEAFGAKPSANAWGSYLMGKYKTLDAIRAALGDDYKDGYGWRLPLVYPPVIGIEYMHFRREWVREYLAIKRDLVTAAFPDKLIITEMRQFGDHDGVQGLGEKKWGGFLDEDNAQWTASGLDNESQPFRIRSVGPPGFGTRPSDSLESLFRDYLWLNFRDPGNLTRYFYHWVAHGYMDYQLGWHSVLNHWLTDQSVYALGPTVAATAPQTQRIGVLLPRTTYDLNDGPVYYCQMGWDWLLQAAKLPYTRIDESSVRAGCLRRGPLATLILPRVTALDDALAAEITAWVKQGGLLICDGVPGVTDEFGRTRAEPALAALTGVRSNGTITEAVKDTPLTVTVPHGHYSGKWQAHSDRMPLFDLLAPTTAEVIAGYESGQPAIASNRHGKGRVVTFGYPFGTEAVECERTSIGFQRTYVWFVREPQVVARTAWLRSFLADKLGVRAEYAVEFAEVGRFKGIEAIAPDLHTPKGFTEDKTNPLFIRTVGDPRTGHELEVDREAPDLAIRFFPRSRAGLGTQYVGISTREVHYMGPRATVNMVLSRHSYRCRIHNTKIQAIWDVARNVPVGFTRDATGVSFTVSVPSGCILMLALSETPRVDLVKPAPFPGRSKEQVLADCGRVARRGNSRPPKVALLNDASDLTAWAKDLAGKEPILISYGQAENKPAADTLAAFLKDQFGVNVAMTEQSAKPPPAYDQPLSADWQKPVIFVGDEWTNNDLAMHGAYWGIAYGAHLPFTSTYAWPGKGRAVVSLSRRYALTDETGGIPFMATHALKIRPVKREWPVLRRKLHIAANGADALAAVEMLTREMNH